MDLQLKGKKAIVTGGSAGIGLAIARMLADEGVEVTIPGRNSKKLNEAIASLGRAVHGIEADLGSAAGAMKLIKQVPETDILVNNLGIYESKNFADITDEEWLRYFEVNLLGGIRLARHYFPAMLTRNWGRVIFVSSEAAAETHICKAWPPHRMPLPSRLRRSSSTSIVPLRSSSEWRKKAK